jgi:hypothetical protein
MTTTTDNRPATSAGITPEELALMRRAAARISPAANRNPSAPDPYAALTLPFDASPPTVQEFWIKRDGNAHYCL